MRKHNQIKFTVKEAIEKTLDELKPIEGSLKKENDEFSEQEDLHPYLHVNEDKLFYAKQWCEEFIDLVYHKYGQHIFPRLSMEEIRSLFRKSDEYLLKAFQKLCPITNELRGVKFDCIDWTFILNGIYIPGYLIYPNEYNEKFKISIIDKINRLKNTKKIIESAIGNIKLIDGGYIDTQSMINWTKNNNLSLEVPEFIEEYDAQILKNHENENSVVGNNDCIVKAISLIKEISDELGEELVTVEAVELVAYVLDICIETNDKKPCFNSGKRSLSGFGYKTVTQIAKKTFSSPKISGRQSIEKLNRRKEKLKRFEPYLGKEEFNQLKKYCEKIAASD
jgi:hypothetical protein